MKKPVTFIALFLLVGCVNMQDLRKNEPAVTYTSNKSVANIANCILYGWQQKSIRYGNVFIQDNINLDSGKTVYSETQSEMADVFTKNGITQINFYHQRALFFYRVDDRMDSIKKCL